MACSRLSSPIFMWFWSTDLRILSKNVRNLQFSSIFFRKLSNRTEYYCRARNMMNNELFFVFWISPLSGGLTNGLWGTWEVDGHLFSGFHHCAVALRTDFGAPGRSTGTGRSWRSSARSCRRTGATCAPSSPSAAAAACPLPARCVLICLPVRLKTSS